MSVLSDMLGSWTQRQRAEMPSAHALTTLVEQVALLIESQQSLAARVGQMQSSLDTMQQTSSVVAAHGIQQPIMCPSTPAAAAIVASAAATSVREDEPESDPAQGEAADEERRRRSSVDYGGENQPAVASEETSIDSKLRAKNGARGSILGLFKSRGSPVDSEGNRRGSAARSSVMGALLYGRRHSALQDGHVPGQCVPRRGSVLRATGNMCDPSFVMRPSCGPLYGVNGSGRGKATKKGRHGSLSLNGSERRTPRTEARTQHQSVEFAPTRGAPQSQT